MQYLLLIHDDEKAWSSLSAEDKAAVYQEYGALTSALRESGAYVGGNQLQPTSSAATVRVRESEPVVTDGPFAETKEQLGGYYLIEADSLDEALDWAAKIPSARVGGAIEVRPVVPSRVEAEAAG